MVRAGNAKTMCFQKGNRFGCREEEKESKTRVAVDVERRRRKARPESVAVDVERRRRKARPELQWM